MGVVHGLAGLGRYVPLQGRGPRDIVQGDFEMLPVQAVRALLRIGKGGGIPNNAPCGGPFGTGMSSSSSITKTQLMIKA